jgi:AraC-like DNA-binding protein
MLRYFLCVTSLFLILNQDLNAQDSTKYSTKFIISHLPKSTPHDASIFLASELSSWYPDIQNHRLERDDKGQFWIEVEHNKDTLEYKFTRGGWEAVEGRVNGRARTNRIHIQKKSCAVVPVVIESWEDISIGAYNIYMIFLALISLQGFLLIIAINTIRNKNKVANGFLTVLLVLITLSIIGRASTFSPDIFNWQPRLLLIPELILFTYAPFFYLYIHKLLVIDINQKRFKLTLIPVFLQLVIYIPYLTMNNQTFIYRVMDQELFPFFAISGLVSLIYNIGFWYASKKVLFNYEIHETLSENQNKYVGFLKGVLKIKAVYLIIWVTLTLVFISGTVFGKNWLYITENMIDVLWLLFSFIIFALAFFAVKHPEVLRKKKRYKDLKIDSNEEQLVLRKLNELMFGKQAFKDQNITLHSLAYQIPTSAHTLSRIINQEFNQSFSEYINKHRVEEFIKLATSEEVSYLATAYQVGFNSKPTFNRAFKKIKGSTPREFFRKQ